MTLLGYGTTVKSLDDNDSVSDTVSASTYKKLRDDIKKDVKKAVRDEMMEKEFSDETVLDDSCIDSFSAQQGSDFMKYIPGKNPDDYIRKDSVPCYGCSIPT
jgi:hypothetical protein